MTDQAHHWTFFHREQINHFITFLIRRAKFSGSDFIIWSNSANFPGRKKTFVIPNLKSFSFNPSALNRAWNQTCGNRHYYYYHFIFKVILFYFKVIIVLLFCHLQCTKKLLQNQKWKRWVTERVLHIISTEKYGRFEWDKYCNCIYCTLKATGPNIHITDMFQFK